MIYAILLLLALGLLAAGWFGFRYAFLRHRHLPSNRVRYQRLRLRLRLHPGRGHATLPELWVRWGRFASYRRSAKSRPSLTRWQRWRNPQEHSVFLGRAQWRHALRVPVEEHGLLVAPPRQGKTALLADVILHYPGPVVSTTTKHDVFRSEEAMAVRSGVTLPEGWAVLDPTQVETVQHALDDGEEYETEVLDGDCRDCTAELGERCDPHAAGSTWRQEYRFLRDELPRSAERELEAG